MKTYTIAEILHYAADNKLAIKEHQQWCCGGNKEKFSCCAMEEAAYDLYLGLNLDDEREKLIARISKGLEAMGCPVHSTDAFDDWGSFSAKNQQARYAWLKFAATMAEEQGV
jgi:hypothetical protein